MILMKDKNIILCDLIAIVYLSVYTQFWLLFDLTV